jgi:hypothetical protein
MKRSLLRILPLLVALVGPGFVKAQDVDCSEAYNGQPAKCIHIPCDGWFKEMLGTWKGPFQAYSRELSKNGQTVMRPYQNVINYAETDCMKNSVSGETFILGRATDTYSEFSGLPANTEHGLLVMGAQADGTRFFRTINSKKQLHAYQLVYQNKLASFDVWQLKIPVDGGSPEMEFTAIDGRDFSDTHEHKRNVTVTLRVGPATQPYFQDVVAFGTHTLQK